MHTHVGIALQFSMTHIFCRNAYANATHTTGFPFPITRTKRPRSPSNNMSALLYSPSIPLLGFIRSRGRRLTPTYLFFDFSSNVTQHQISFPCSPLNLLMPSMIRMVQARGMDCYVRRWPSGRWRRRGDVRTCAVHTGMRSIVTYGV